jgi:hypothetical protein
VLLACIYAFFCVLALVLLQVLLTSMLVVLGVCAAVLIISQRSLQVS